MKKIIVIRHCSATGQERDAELTTDGKNQANTLATFLLENQLQIEIILFQAHLYELSILFGPMHSKLTCLSKKMND